MLHEELKKTAHSSRFSRLENFCVFPDVQFLVNFYCFPLSLAQWFTLHGHSNPSDNLEILNLGNQNTKQDLFRPIKNMEWHWIYSLQYSSIDTNTRRELREICLWWCKKKQISRHSPIEQTRRAIAKRCKWRNETKNGNRRKIGQHFGNIGKCD